ncbi:MAG: efflux RND transporter permease subunit [Phycisphaerae bacterium]|nr:efflux RND transporter permease subunit [Phycisphaerae bacterium]
MKSMNEFGFAVLLLCLLFAGCAAQSEPIVRITVEYPGASPEDIERTLTLTIETKLHSVENTQSITSISSEGKVEIYAKGIKGTDPTKFTNQIKKAVDSVEEELPVDAKPATVQLLGDGVEIPKVNIQPVDEIQIIINNEKANALGISREQIFNAMRRTLKDRQVEQGNVKTIGEIILTVDGKKILLKDVAEIELVQRPGSIVRKYPPTTPR